MKILSDKTLTLLKIPRSNSWPWRAQWRPATFLAIIQTKKKMLHKARTSKALCSKCLRLTNEKLMEWLWTDSQLSRESFLEKLVGFPWNYWLLWAKLSSKTRQLLIIHLNLPKIIYQSPIRKPGRANKVCWTLMILKCLQNSKPQIYSTIKIGDLCQLIQPLQKTNNFKGIELANNKQCLKQLPTLLRWLLPIEIIIQAKIMATPWAKQIGRIAVLWQKEKELLFRFSTPSIPSWVQK